MSTIQFQKKTLSIQDLSELVSAIRNFNLDINKYEENKEINEEIYLNNDSNAALYLNIEVVANTFKDDSDFRYNGYGHAYINNEDGYFFLKKIQPYYEGIGKVEFDELSMKVINAEINDLNIFK